MISFKKSTFGQLHLAVCKTAEVSMQLCYTFKVNPCSYAI